MNSRVKYGLIAGGIYIIATLLIYLIGYSVFFNAAWTGFWIMWAFVIYFGFKIRKEEGGYISYKNALISLFTIFIIAELLYTAFNFALHNVIDPNLGNTKKEYALRKVEESEDQVVKIMGEKMYEEMIEKVENEDQSVTLASSIKGFGKWAVFGFVVCLIAAFIVKKNRPLFE